MTFAALTPRAIATDVDIMISNNAVAQLVVRDLEEDVKKRLQRRARRHGRSTEAEVREILRAAVAGESSVSSALGSRLAERFSKIGLDEPIQELRGQVAKPASLRK
jgi:plasmid stability protein